MATAVSYNAHSASSDTVQTLLDNISRNIQSFPQHVRNVEEFGRKIGSPHDSVHLRSQLREEIAKTNELASKTRDLLKDLENLPRLDNATEERRKKLRTKRLLDQFTELLGNFQTVQREVLSKERESFKEERRLSESKSGPTPRAGGGGVGRQDNFLIDIQGEGGDGVEGDGAAGEGQSKMEQLVEMEQAVDLAQAEERQEALRQLETDILGVNEIFKDLGMMVHEQGEVITTIETAITDASENVVSANQQLTKARDYQSKARRKKCICITILVSILAVAILVVVIYFAANSDSSSSPPATQSPVSTNKPSK